MGYEIFKLVSLVSTTLFVSHFFFSQVTPVVAPFIRKRVAR